MAVTSTDPTFTSAPPLDAVVDHAPILLAAFDLDGIYTLAEGRGLALAGLTRDALIGRGVTEVFGERIQVLEALDAVRSGASRHFTLDLLGIHWDVRITPLLTAGVVLGGLLVATDITESIHVRHALEAEIRVRQRRELELLQLASIDGLTGLPNRDELTRLLQRSADNARDAGTGLTVAFVDLDNFKVINDSLGHAIGDEVLQVIADRLRLTAHPDDVVARFASDEFVVVSHGPSKDQADVVTRSLTAALAPAVRIAGNEVFVTGSIGLASSPPYDAATLLRNADAAMYRAKDRGRDRVETFDQALEADAFTALLLRTELHHALERDEFVLHYQPVVDLGTGRLNGMEALIRWNHPERGLVPPLAFIPAAEESGFIVEMGAWVLHEACRQAAEWPAPLHVAVNLSVRQLADDDIVATVAHALAISGLDPGRLVLEVTESALMANAESAVGYLIDLKHLGVQLAIDDFGTGYSSLVYLKRMPVDIIKIDRSFVDGLGTDPEDTAIVESVVSLAHAVGVKTVAEGVETQRQFDALCALGCDFGQGYLWSRPVPDDALAPLLDPSFSTEVR